MASVTTEEVKEKYLRYIEFKQEFDRLEKDDQAVLKPYHDKLLKSWNDANRSRSEAAAKKRLQ
jgi:hypothetical protein